MAVGDTGSLLVVGYLLLFHTWGAWAMVEVNMEDRVEVNLGDTAQLTCTFTSEDGPGGTIIQWIYVTRSGEKQRIYNLESTMSYPEKGTPFTDRISVNSTVATGKAVLTIENVQLQDELEFICLVKGLTDGTAEGRTKLRVFQTPEEPTIEGVKDGISVQDSTPSKIGICEVKNGYPQPNITWYKADTPIRSVRGEVNVVPSIITKSNGLFSVKSELFMKVVKEYADALFYCEVTYFVPGGTQMVETSFINITVYYPHTSLNMWVESPKGKIKEGDSVEIRCDGDGTTPFVTFTISGGGQNATNESNVLVIENTSRLDSGAYYCSSLDMETFEEVTADTNVFINYLEDVVIEPGKIIEVSQGEEQNATCNALSSLPTQTAWFKNEVEFSTGHTLVLQDATFDTAGTYVCEVTAVEVEGMKRRGELQVYVLGAPEILTSGGEMEESVGSTVDRSCQVRGYPYPSVTWSTSEGKILSTASEEKTDDGVISSVEVKITGDITVFCNATNKFGDKSVAFSIKASIHTTPAITSTTSTTSSSTTTTTTDSTGIHTTPAITSTTSTTSSSTTTTTTDSTVKPGTNEIQKESSGFIIAVIIICILLLALLGSVLFYLYKKGKICGRSGKQDLTKGKPNKDNIVVEMKSDNTEDAVLLGVNGEK